jgi:hypothetical protein
MAKVSLSDWVHDAMVDGDKQLGGQQDSPLSMIALVHMAGGGGVGGMEREVKTIKMGTGKPWTAEELGKLFQRTAETYCQDATSVQTFALHAFYGGDIPKATHPFIVNVNPANAGFFGEAADDRGERQQHMRQKEMVFQQMLAQQQSLNSFMIRALEVSSRDAHDAKRESKEMTEIMKEMIMERAMNNHDFQMKEIAAQRASKTQAQLLKMVPPLVNTVAGRNVFPVETSDTALVELIAESLDAESLGKLAGAGAIPPALMGPLMARMQQHLAKKREEQDAQAKLLPAAGNPEDDAAGGS